MVFKIIKGDILYTATLDIKPQYAWSQSWHYIEGYYVRPAESMYAISTLQRERMQDKMQQY